MFTQRKQAKAYLKNCTRAEYNDLIVKAYFTNRQLKIAILVKADNNIPTWEMANRLAVSPDTISRELKNIYDKIARVILV